MKKIVQQALFIIPIAALIAAPLVIDHKKNENLESKFSSADTSANHHDDVNFNLPHVVDNEQYAMSEPFSEHSFFIHPCNMGNPMDPAAWMSMMMRMMNYMQMTQMMQQMTKMPTGMMNPSTNWMNPHMMMPNQPNSPKQPLSPEEYKKWYNEQLKK